MPGPDRLQPHDEMQAEANRPAPRAIPAEGRIVATPIARRMAREKQIDLARLAGSGPGGRIVEADVLAQMARQEEGGIPASRDEGIPHDLVPLTGAQVVTGQRMALSSQTIPQFCLEVDVDMSETVRWRERAARAGRKPAGFTALLVKVAAAALALYPRVNASLDGHCIRLYREIHLGVAMASPDGLLVPVICRPDSLRLNQIQQKLDEIRIQIASGRLEAEYLQTGTFTLSNLGMFGVDRFRALVNPPQAAILAAGRIRGQPWEGPSGIQNRPTLTLSLAVDHRVLDGATAAPFLAELKTLLEEPYLLL
jgi:pyruvate dehydrogenase E2 component (dihydrolipoamide acetyltransferase)